MLSKARATHNTEPLVEAPCSVDGLRGFAGSPWNALQDSLLYKFLTCGEKRRLLASSDRRQARILRAWRIIENELLATEPPRHWWDRR